VPAAQRQAVRQLVATLGKKGAVSQIPIEAWIDSSHLIRRIRLNFTQALGSGQSATVAMTENFLRYGPQSLPAIPPRSQAVNLLTLTHAQP
jgi:hypothetical protein